MPDDSNGIYSVPAGTIVSTGDTILPSQHNPWANDSASAISNRFSKDGRAPATGNWNLNNFRITGLGAPVAGGDAVNKTYADGLIVQPSVDVASAATTDIGAASSENVRITGSVTITSFGIAPAGTFRRLTFAASPLLTYNATSLILPGAVSITMAAGDVAEFVSEGSGNWRCVDFTPASGISPQVPARPAIAGGGVGHFALIDTSASVGNGYSLPGGGTWAYFMFRVNGSTGGVPASNAAGGVAAGGTTILPGLASHLIYGFAWRIA